MSYTGKIIDYLSAVVIVLKRVLQLAVWPYKTMRSISQEQNWNQILIIFITVLIYYELVFRIKHIANIPLIQTGIVFGNYVATVVFLYFFTRIFTNKADSTKFFFLTAYALIPTIIWFYLNSFLFVLIPPPRQLTIAGKAFSILFTTISMSLLTWKIILFYLAIRFASSLRFFTIFFILLLYTACVIPYSLLLYHAGYFRIPFL